MNSSNDGTPLKMISPRPPNFKDLAQIKEKPAVKKQPKVVKEEKEESKSKVKQEAPQQLSLKDRIALMVKEKAEKRSPKKTSSLSPPVRKNNNEFVNQEMSLTSQL